MSLVDNLEVHLLRNGFGRESDHPRTFRRNGEVAEEVVLYRGLFDGFVIEYSSDSTSHATGRLIRNSQEEFRPDEAAEKILRELDIDRQFLPQIAA